MAFNYVKEEFVKIIELTDWMGESTKNMAKKKVQSMGAYIAYPEQMLNRNIIDEFYQEVNTREDCNNIVNEYHLYSFKWTQMTLPVIL